MINLIGKLLTACAASSLWFEFGFTSLVFFGESAYPDPEEE